MKEILSHNEVAINDSKILSKLKLKKDNYFLVSSHREENIDNVSNFSLLKNMLESLSKNSLCQ